MSLRLLSSDFITDCNADCQIMEDVSEEHARKTITVDPFPHSSVVAASIHPCKHASVVKKLGQMAEAGGKEFKVEKYVSCFCGFYALSVPYGLCFQ